MKLRGGTAHLLGEKAMPRKRQKPEIVKESTSITMSINGACFHAEGDAAEVTAKFNKWLDDTLAPIKAFKDLAEKSLGK